MRRIVRITLLAAAVTTPVVGKMYWSDTQDNRMYRANLDGTSMQTIVNLGTQLGCPTLDVAGGKIYFGNYGDGDMCRANLDGSALQILFGGLYTPVAVDFSDLVALLAAWGPC